MADTNPITPEVELLETGNKGDDTPPESPRATTSSDATEQKTLVAGTAKAKGGFFGVVKAAKHADTTHELATGETKGTSLMEVVQAAKASAKAKADDSDGDDDDDEEAPVQKTACQKVQYVCFTKKLCDYIVIAVMIIICIAAPAVDLIVIPEGAVDDCPPPHALFPSVFPSGTARALICDGASLEPACNRSGLVWVGANDLEISNDELAALGNLTVPLCNLTEVPGSEFQTSLPDGYRTVLSIIPFVVVFQGILSFKLSSKHVAPFALLVVIMIGLEYFRDAKFFDGDALPEAIGKVALVIVDRAFWTLLDYAFSVFTAFFFLRVLQLWGIVDSMRVEFEGIAHTPTRKILLVAFCFAIALGVVAPGGSNFVIAGSILISMNVMKLAEDDPERLASNRRIGALALFGNALTSAFNLLGICISTIGEDLEPLDPTFNEDAPRRQLYGQSLPEIEIGRLFSMQFLILGTIAPVLMAYIFSSKKSMGEKLKDISADVPICVLTGFVYAVLQLLVAAFLGPKLPCLLAGGGALAFYVTYEKLTNRQPKRAGAASPFSKAELAKRCYMIPFALLIGVLVLIGVIPGVADLLSGAVGEDPDNNPARAILDPVIISINSGGSKFEHRFSYLTNSAVIVLVVGLVTPFIVPFREVTKEVLTFGGLHDNAFGASDTIHSGRFKRNAKKVIGRLHAIAMMKSKKKDAPEPTIGQRRKNVLWSSFSEATEDVLPVLFSITSFASIAKLMDKFGMTKAIALAIVSALESVPVLFVVVMPMIGMLGSGLTGSTTTSNFLFARLQVSTALELGLLDKFNSVYEVGGLQILGASAGEIISPMNAVVITIMEGVKCNESVLITQLLPTAFIWLFLCMIISLVFMLTPLD